MTFPGSGCALTPTIDDIETPASATTTPPAATSHIHRSDQTRSPSSRASHIYTPRPRSPGNLFIPAHKNFRVVAIAAPVPPFPGHPLDPPFRSRFQARFVDPVGAFLALCPPPSVPETELESRLRELVLSTQYASEVRDTLSAVSKNALPPFPQTALQKLRVLATAFPPPDADALSSSQLGRLMVVLNPALVYAPMQAWAILSRQTEETGLGALGSPVSPDDEDGQGAGLLGYSLASIARVTPTSATAVFTYPSGSLPDVSLAVPAGPAPLRPFPFSSSSSPSVQTSVYSSPPFTPSPRFVGLLTALVQAHALGWDVLLVPPAAPATASSSTSTLVRVFGEILGYTGSNAEAVHMYKELGGRELFMRRRILDGGATAWEPSAIVEAAWVGKLMHLSGLDVIGPTAGALARLVQDREMELWAGKRIVGEATPTVCPLPLLFSLHLSSPTPTLMPLVLVSQIDSGASTLSLAHPSFRLIPTASKSLLLKDWLSAEHANMFFPVPAQPMGRVEEEAILLATGCAPRAVKRMLAFAERYWASMSEDSVQKNRKLGTRSLVRVARRMAEADKAPEHVERPSDIAVHLNFRLVLLANRPGYPFLGNHFLQVLGETFSAHSVTNPDQESERTLLAQLAPEINKDLILHLVGAFHDLRKGYDAGTLNYPYSLRELINLVKHLQAYPGDSLGDALWNVFDFDVYKPETIEQLAAILAHHGLASHAPHLGLAAAQEAAKKKIQDAKFEPKNTELGEPKEGDHDNKEHSGGNKWAGGEILLIAV
ncbi:hypothetical protein B0H14DRAFT_3592622 [Mycena olivaceomarginata]|nr:hypothetical protein B0H14DRAFT_3592622 [Mycena olivaceomarginata]